MALGLALLFSVMGLMNFAYGELIMIGAYSLYVGKDLPWPVQLAVCVLVVIVASLLMDRLAFRPFRGASAPVLFITSFALSFALQSVATVIFGSRAKGIALPSFFDQTISVGSLSFSSLNLISVALVGLLLVALATFLKRTPSGVQMRAAAESFSTARLVGVKADRVIALAFVLSGFSAAVAAILITAQLGTATPTVGTGPILVAFVATIIGGLGSLNGAAAGGMLLGVLTVLLQVFLPEGLAPYREAFLYGGVIIVLIARPQGLIVVKSVFERV
jgi:branched-chain amino acid transport system permease protein